MDVYDPSLLVLVGKAKKAHWPGDKSKGILTSGGFELPLVFHIDAPGIH